MSHTSAVVAISAGESKFLLGDPDDKAFANWQKDWIDQVESIRACSVELHPDLAGQLPASSRPLLLYLAYTDGTLTTLSLLHPKELRVFSQRGFSRLGRLQGYRLAGNQIFGECTSEALERFLDAMDRVFRQNLSDCIFIEDLDLQTELWSSLASRKRAGRASVHQLRVPQAHLRIHFPENAEDYWGNVSGKSRYKVRRKARGLEHEVKKYCSKSDVEEFLLSAEKVSLKSWQGKRIGLRVQVDERSRSFYGALAELGALRSYVMFHNEEPIAFVYGWQWNGRFEYEEIAYDISFRDHAPGRILLYKILEDLIADNTPDFLDFGAGDAEYKRTFCTDDTSSVPVVLLAQNSSARMWLGLRKLRAAISGLLRGILRKTGLYEKIRKAYRQG